MKRSQCVYGARDARATRAVHGVGAIRFAVAFILIAWCVVGIAAQTQGMSHKVLANGLEVFAVENKAVPLVTVCVAFRGGASAQTPATAGLFHLYEHMLFAGNSKFPTPAAFTAAMNRMGTSSWNGATGPEYINYYITVPSSKMEEGIAFWAAAVRDPSFVPEVLENEKQVVLNEITGYHNDPAQIAANAIDSRMFVDMPWRKNIDGPNKNIEQATVAQLKALQAEFYIPKNMALFVGGDLTAEEVYAIAEKYFGDWAGGNAPVFGEPPHGAVPTGVHVIVPDASFYRGISQVQFHWRGPDVLRQTNDTYISDVLLFLLSSPVGRFKSSIMEKVPGLYDPEYIQFSYPTARDGGEYIFSTFMLTQNPSKEGAVLARVEALRAAVLEEFALIAKNPEEYFGAKELEKAKTKLIDQNLFAAETPDSFVTDTLTFWWSVATADYFFAYEKNCRAVTWADISSLVIRYLTGASGISGAGNAASPTSASLVRTRTSTYDADAQMSDMLAKYGYTRVGPENAFWWQK